MKRPTTWNALAGLALAGLAVTAVTGCQARLKAPREAGFCYVIGHPANGEVKFNVVAKDVPTLEHCAVQIYNTRMNRLATGTAGDVTEGTYGGSFLWADNREVRYSQHYEGPRLPFLVRAPGNRLVQPGSIVIEEDLPTEQTTVELPDNLPKTN